MKAEFKFDSGRVEVEIAENSLNLTFYQQHYCVGELEVLKDGKIAVAATNMTILNFSTPHMFLTTLEKWYEAEQNAH
jgi:hypothetical protein